MATREAIVKDEMMQRDLLDVIAQFKKIKFPVPFIGGQVARSLNRNLETIIAEYEIAVQSGTAPNKFAAMAAMEKKLCILINTALQEIPPTAPLNKHSGNLEAVKKIQAANINMNFCLAKHISHITSQGLESATKDLYSEIDNISKKISMDSSNIERRPDVRGDELSVENIRKITAVSRDLIIVTLLKAADTPSGCALIHDLCVKLQNPSDLQIMPTLTFPEDCLSVFPKATSAHMQVELVNPEGVPLTERAERLGTKSASSGSVITIPIIDPVDTLEYFRQPMVVEEALGELQSGWVTSSPQGLFYHPFQIQVIHELTHVQRNINGENAKIIPITAEEKRQWSSYEEYQAIVGGTFNESQFIGASMKLLCPKMQYQ